MREIIQIEMAHGLKHRRLNKPPYPGAVPFMQCGQNALCRVKSRHGIGDCRTNHAGVLRVDEQTQKAACGLRNGIKGRTIPIRAFTSKAGNGCVDQLRIARAQPLRIDIQPSRDTRSEILDENIGRFQQAIKDRQIIRVAGVKRDALLVAIIGLEVRAIQFTLKGTEWIPGSGLFNLDYIGTQVREQHARGRTCDEGAHFKHGHILQWFRCHAPSRLVKLLLTLALQNSNNEINFGIRKTESIMRIGKQDEPYTSIATSDATSITVRGLDLSSEIIGKMDFTSYFWLLVTGMQPNPAQQFLANAVLCAIAEHGLVPSVVATRMTIAAAPEAFQGAVAAGLLGCGSVVLGSAETAGRFYAECIAAAETDGISYQEAAAGGIRALRAEKKAIPGFGHPEHSDGDPRAHRLLALAKEQGIEGKHIEMLRAVEAVLPETIGRSLPINVNGAIPVVMLDARFPLAALKGISLLARTASLIGHLQEESERPIGFIMSGAAAARIDFV